ncbi:MAG: hypothetical protein ACREIR_14580, partial [Geminicoccaceae bacterium]
MKSQTYTVIGAALLAFVPLGADAADRDWKDDGHGRAPRFEVDHSWPKELPNNWLIGQVGGIAVDRHDNIWILQRARTLTNDEAGATDAYV